MRRRPIRHSALRSIAALAAILMALAGSASAADRVALLIGNATYSNPDLLLDNPAHDANGLAASLTSLDFKVTVLVDADRARAVAALGDFMAAAKGADMALFFFAGHGVQIEGENHLLTAGFRQLTLDEISRESISLSEIRKVFADAQPGLGVIILDACRNNPFVDSGLAARGLARSQGGSGILIAYATDPGNVAFDGLGKNSTFTEALIDHIAAPGLEARLMFGRVRQQVALTTGGLQVPWVEESVLGTHYFNPDFSATPIEPEVARDVQTWRTVSSEGGRAAYETYLASFPDGLFKTFAEERVARLEDAATDDRPVSDASALLADADRDRVVAALSTLGFLSRVRGQSTPDPDVASALASYEREMTDSGVADLDRLYLDAAQVTVVLGATTAQRIRTDMVALASIETTLAMAGRAREELAGLATTEASARPALAAADTDIAAIRAARARVLDRLDQSRSYYAELLQRAETEFRPYLERSMSGLLEKSRSLPDLEQRVVEDAGTFIRHATTLADATPQGSYAWLADFLPKEPSQE